MIPQSTFDALQQAEEDIYNPQMFLIPGSHKQIGNWSGQGLQDDGVWITTAGFTIFTMTSGFGLLESGRVSSKDEVNIMVKNVIDVIFGGLAYWMIGFSFSFGASDNNTNPYIGTGEFFFDPFSTDENTEGWIYASFIYQMSFATTTSAIVSAGMAERVHLRAYIIVSFVMTLIHAVPAHWVWSEDGMLWSMGVIDYAGCSVVHLVGGVAGLIATIYLRPRQHRFGKQGRKQLSNPTNAILGTFMLWWGWLGFNTGSTYGVSHGKWQLASRSAVATVLASTGGGLTSLVISMIRDKIIQIDMLIDGLLAALVASTACCPCLCPWEAVVVGTVAAALVFITYPILEKIEIDDPVGVVPVHVVGATWGMLSAGIFAKDDPFNFEVTRNQDGLLYGGGFVLLRKQLIAVLAVSAWSGIVGFITMFLLEHSPIGLRLSKYEEELGADLREHGLQGHFIRTYRMEKKLTAESVTSVMMLMFRWKAKARLGAIRRKRVKEAAQAGGQELASINNGALTKRTPRGAGTGTATQQQTGQ